MDGTCQYVRTKGVSGLHFNVDVSSMVDAGASPGEVAGRDPGTSAKLAGVRRLPAPE